MYVCIKVCKGCYISYIDYRNKNSELYITKILDRLDIRSRGCNLISQYSVTKV